jgi:hypothetical protein
MIDAYEPIETLTFCPLRTMIYHYGGDQTALVRNLENLLPICSLRFG